MPARIDKLTDAQQARIPEWVEKWIKIGRSTQPADKLKAEAAITKCYEFSKLKAPKFVWVPSPIVAAIAGPIYCELEDNQKNALTYPNLTDLITNENRKIIQDNWNLWYGGSAWCSWPAYISFFIDVCNLELKPEILDRYRAYEQTVLHGGYWWPGIEYCMCSERPYVFAQDGRNRLHSETGPALGWEDWKLWYINGVEVTEQIVMRPDTLTVAQINNEQNAEAKRVMIDRFTPSRYLKEVNAELIHTDFEGAKKGAAPRMLLRAPGGQQWLVGTDGSTKRVYYMNVPNEVKTCAEAHVAICGFDESKILAKS